MEVKRSGRHGRSPRRLPALTAIVSAAVLGAATPVAAQRASTGDSQLRPPDKSMFAALPGDSSSRPGLMGVVMSGDGGWHTFDRGLVTMLADDGIPVLAWNSLSYYGKKRTPEEAAALLQKGLEQYMAAWHRNRVVLVGYSFGADVMPFLINRLDPAMRSRVAGVVLLGFAGEASFKFHIEEWIGITVGKTWPTLPELDRMPDVPLLCMYGKGDKSEACSAIDRPHARTVALASGHRLNAVTAEVRQRILSFVAALAPATAVSR